MPDMTATLDMLDWTRGLYDLSWLEGWEATRLWRIEQYLIRRLERVGVAAPPDPNDDPAHELIEFELGGSD